MRRICGRALVGRSAGDRPWFRSALCPTRPLLVLRLTVLRAETGHEQRRHGQSRRGTRQPRIRRSARWTYWVRRGGRNRKRRPVANESRVTRHVLRPPPNGRTDWLFWWL